MRSREVVTSVLSVVVTLLVSHALHAQGQEEASRIYLNQSLFHLRQAQLYADRSVQTLPLSGFDYAVFQRDLDTVADGVETFLHPRPGDPVRVVPVEIDGHYLAEELVREGKTLEEIMGVEPEEDSTEWLLEESEPENR
jgi:RAQPRD family integrative conjugative element protein